MESLWMSHQLDPEPNRRTLPLLRPQLASQSPHPGPGVQLRGGNRQVRTMVPPLARGVTPVIAGSGEAG